MKRDKLYNVKYLASFKGNSKWSSSFDEGEVTVIAWDAQDAINRFSPYKKALWLKSERTKELKSLSFLSVELISEIQIT
jgi:hypothetical protein